MRSAPRTADLSASARDWIAEIDDAIAIVLGECMPVTVAAGTAAERCVEFVDASVPVSSSASWLPFGGSLGELSADGSTLRVGLGALEALDAERARRAGAAAGAHLGSGEVAVRAPAAVMEAIVDGLVTAYPGGGPLHLAVGSFDVSAASRGVLAADVTRLARLLTSAPANVLTPRRAGEWAAEIARRAGLECSVLDADEIRDRGFGALDVIGAGSRNKPVLVELSYRASDSPSHIALVGKGITFDSGGLSLKSPEAMQSMRLDVAGAATVLAVMAALARAQCPVNVHAVLPFAENMPGPGAARPGDVVTAWNGTQIQILDTDFEGRVVLADTLALAASHGPDLLVDLATLTYQAEIALGPEIGAVLGRDDAAVARLLRAAAAAGEPMWQLPWAERYLHQVHTPHGVRNHPLHDTGRALTAALFLGAFVKPQVPWVHCDITGPAWAGDASCDGATGFGARTLLRLLEASA